MPGLRASICQTLVLQALIVLGTSAVYAVTSGQLEMFSAAYGGGCALILGLLLGLSTDRLARQTQQRKAVQSPAILAMGVVPRLLLTVLLFWFGLWQLQLVPVPMVVGFSLVYFGYLISFYKLK